MPASSLHIFYVSGETRWETEGLFLQSRGFFIALLYRGANAMFHRTATILRGEGLLEQVGGGMPAVPVSMMAAWDANRALPGGGGKKSRTDLSGTPVQGA